MERSFWLVWNQDGGTPTVRHNSVHSATMEAERLARAMPGRRFIVLQSIVAREVNNMAHIEFDCDPNEPF